MADISSNGKSAPSGPMNVEQIVEKAQSFDYNPLIPLKYWLRTAGTLLKEAEIYEHEGNDQQTYLLLFRHAQLVLRNLSTHPDARQLQNRHILTLANKEVEKSLAKLEVLKPRLNKRYERYEQLLKDQDNRTATTGGSENVGRRSQDGPTDRESRQIPLDPTLSGGTEALTAGDNRDLAVKLARKEIKRRATAKRAVRQAGISKEDEQGRRTAGSWGSWEEAFAKNDQGSNHDALSEQIQNLRLQVNRKYTGGPPNRDSFSSLEGQRSSYHYPSIPEKSAYQDLSPNILRSDSGEYLQPQHTSNSTQAPELPPKNRLDLTMNELQSTNSQQQSGSDQMITVRSATASPPPDLQPSTFTFKPSAYLENGTPLRTIFLPPDLRFRFLSLALTNTRANLETCGILCGTLISNALFISKLVIPDQESTSDTCETVNEDKLFDFVDGEDLMMLGWIHTHPTQTCFMSSRDLHTHSGYQAMMPESIAIVCAPSKGDWGVFRLTDPPGMKSVLSCTQKGLFHPHSETNIYTGALRPGHVYEAKGLEYDVVDLRPVR